MFLEIPDLLTPAELSRLQQVGKIGTFVDGRASNPHSRVKQNWALRLNDPLYAETSRMMAEALQRNELFRNASFPKVMAPPMLTRYPAGNAYGLHSDAAFLPIGERPLRSDLSCTIFVSPPDTYVGGALSVMLGARRMEIKAAAGTSVIYPSDTLHEVTPVVSGERLVGLTFVESRIADRSRRELLYELNEVAALEGLGMQWENFTRLQHVQMSLLRMWAESN